MAVTVLASYDVRQDATRSRLAAILQCHGDRIQKSVFILQVDTEDLAMITEKATALLDLDVDSFFLLRVCGSCWSEITHIGQSHVAPPVLYWAAL